MNESAYNEGREKILSMRRAVYKIDGVSAAFIVAAIALSFVSRTLAIIVALVLGGIHYGRLRAAAHYPCPRCSEAFGTAAAWPIGFGGGVCQSCGLGLWA